MRMRPLVFLFRLVVACTIGSAASAPVSAWWRPPQIADPPVPNTEAAATAVTPFPASLSWSGVLDLSNVLWAFSIVLILTACTRLCGMYLLHVLLKSNLVLLELLGYGAAYACVYFPYHYLSHATSMAPVFVALTGCWAMVPLYFFTLSLHVASDTGRVKEAVQVLGFLCAGAWGVVAVLFHSTLIGFCAVAALFTALGFFAATTPFCYMLGFTSGDAIPRCMGAAFYLFCTYVWMAVRGLAAQVPEYRVFRPGVLGFGTGVYFLGWLIVSNRHYHNWTVSDELRLQRYALANVLALASGCAAIVVGGWHPELKLLQSVGGTFFGLLLLDKYTELPWRQREWAWCMLFGGMLLWALGYVAQMYPEYVLNWAALSAAAVPTAPA